MATKGDKEIKAILEAIDKGIIDFQEAIPKIQERIYNKLLLFQKELSVQGETITNTVKNVKLLGSLKNEIETIILDDTDYLEAVAKFSKLYDLVTKLNNNYFKAIESKFTPSKVIEEVRKQSVSLVIDGLTESGLQSNFINPVREIINTYVTTGGSYSKLSGELNNYINGYSSDAGPIDGSFVKFTKQITTDALNQYNAQVNEITSLDLGWEWYRYVGSNIKTTRTFCEALTKKEYYHRSELAQIIKGNFAEFKEMKGQIYDKTGLPQGMYDDTNTSNFPIYRGGYNCGHQAYAIPTYLVPQSIRKSIGKN
jgi:hypothetical protein